MRSLEHDDHMYIFGMQNLINSRIHLFMHRILYLHIYTLNPKRSCLCYTSVYSSLPVLNVCSATEYDAGFALSYT